MTARSPVTPQPEASENSPIQTDVLIVGAGLSGIGMAAHLQDQCRGARFIILESRQATGGTWDLFRYPGIRSDSDMYTMGYRFNPWNRSETVASGPLILDYLRETATERGIDQHIRLGHQVTRCEWDSTSARWTVTAVNEEGEQIFVAPYLVTATGYYHYDHGYTPDFPGMTDFDGPIIHPQHWPEDFDYTDKRLIVVGSGATAVTLLPNLARQAQHVTMLQRSPTYMFTAPAQDPISLALRGRVPDKWIYNLGRIRNIGWQMLSYQMSRHRPAKASDYLLGLVAEQLPDDADIADFTPHYRPWDQRLCLVPDGDLFAAIRSGKAEVVTGEIERFTSNGIELSDGRSLAADAIVTATGFDLLVLGGIQLVVDGQDVDISKTKVYKGMMFSGVPNLAFLVGYTNASWTLKVDLVASHFCRLLQHMRRRGYDYCVPRADDPTLRSEPMMPLSSGYIQRSKSVLPDEGHRSPWRLRQNYLLDLLNLRFGRIRDPELELGRSPAARGSMAKPAG